MHIEHVTRKGKTASRFHFIRFSAAIVIATLLTLSSYTGIAGQQPGGAGAATAEPADNSVLCPPGLTRRDAVEPVVPVSAEEPTVVTPSKTPPNILKAQGCALMATLVGFTTRPGGPVRGFGFIVLMLDTNNNQICYAMHMDGIRFPGTALHVHYRNGGVAAQLPAPKD